MRDMIEICTERSIARGKDLVADWNIAKMGAPVGEEAASSMLSIQKQATMRNMKPVTAPIQTAQMIALGASLRASFISSVMCAVASGNSQL